MFRYTFLDLVRALALVAAAACADVTAPRPAPVDVHAAAPIDDVATVVRAAEDAERQACDALLGTSPETGCEAR